ncbi:MAG: CBS domain-containing protein [Massilia sp.]
MKVAAVLKTKGNALFTVTPRTLLSECVITMAEQDIGSIVVMSGAELKGIITFREVLRVLARRQVEMRRGPTPPVAELLAEQVMVSSPATATPDMDTDELRDLMLSQHQRYIPVLDGTTLVGVVSYHDVMRSQNEQQKFENSMLKAYIADWPEEPRVQ